MPRQHDVDELLDAITGADELGTLLSLSVIRRDGGTQPRAALDGQTIEEYAERMRQGDRFPPVVVFNDGKHYWLADGFHRCAAAEDADMAEIAAHERQGTQRDARLYSAGVNADHGLRRTNADKRRAVIVLLSDPEWSQWSDREIARRCKVSQPFVSNLRSTLSDNRYQMSDDAVLAEKVGVKPEIVRQARQNVRQDDGTRKVQRGGTTYEQAASSGKRSRASSRRSSGSATRSSVRSYDPDERVTNGQSSGPHPFRMAVRHQHELEKLFNQLADWLARDQEFEVEVTPR